MALLRPICMTLPIWPWARRCIQTKKRISRVTGISSGISDVKKLGWGVTNVSVVWDRIRSVSSSGSGVGPTVVNSMPDTSTKSMSPLVLSYSASTTWPSSTRWMKSV